MAENLTLEEVEAKIAEYTQLRRDLAQKQGKPTVEALFAPLFRYPGIKAASWTQYTPYFNDGEPCEFNVYADLRLYAGDELGDGEEYYEDEEYGFSFDSYSIPDSIPDVYVRPEPDAYYTRHDTWLGRNRMAEWENYQQREERRVNAWRESGWTDAQLRGLKEKVREIENWLGSHEEFLEDVFGDHVQVRVAAFGEIEVTEYDHD